MKTFRHGTHPPANKITEDRQLVDFEVPEILYFALSQHIGAPAKPVVAAGDTVKEGQLIAESGGFVSAPVYSSVSGTVKGIVSLPTATGGKCDHIVVENDFKYDKTGLTPLENPSKEEIVARVKEAGIVGMGGATFPTHVKLSPSKPVDTLIINAAECEPYITCDYRLLVECTDEVVKGVLLLMKALGVDKAYIGVESNKPLAIKALAEACPESVEVVKLKTKYPQGAEKQLIYAVTYRKVPAGGLPMDVGCVVDNVHTAYSTARAVLLGEPLYMRAMTVSGGGVEHIGNYRVRTGTTYSFVYEKTRGSVPEEETGKVISGGPMMGFSQADLRACCTKGTSSLLFLTRKQFNMMEPTQCINCGRCIRNCPMFLLPRDLERAVIAKDFEKAAALGVANCMECGVCSYVCPAKRPLVQAFRLAKKTIRERGIK